VQVRRGVIKHEYIKNHSCPGEWLLGCAIDVLDKYREDDRWVLLCDVLIPATGKFEKFNIPEEYVEYTDGKDTETVPSADSEQIVHEG
jgi:hypothetical protein